jgi:hypothetical protein
MFRLIAIALTSTFLLLALFGTSSEPVSSTPPTRAMGVIGVVRAEAMDSGALRPQYVVRHHQPMKSAPEPGASVLRILPYGATVDLIDASRGEFVQIREGSGEVGFVNANSLSDRFPG